MIRRILGLIILLISLIAVVLLLGGAYYAGQAVDSAALAVDNVLALTVDSLSTVSSTLEQTKATIVEANNTVETAVSLTANLSNTVADTRPVLDSVGAVVSEDVPANIEAIQTAIPNVAHVAGVVDSAMTTLSNFGIEQTIPIPFNPITLEFDLGIEYEPEEPFDQSILALGDSLEGMPDELRSLQGDLDVLSSDLELVSADILATSDDLAALNEQVALFIPLLDEYLNIVNQIIDSMSQAQAQLMTQLETIKSAIIIILVFLALTQLAPLYLGWELLSGQRSGQREEETPPREIESTPPAVEETAQAPAEPVVAAESQAAAVAEEPSPDLLEPAPEDLYDPATETMIEGPKIDSSPTIVDESPPDAQT
ncbi:MAG: hypothetical protein R3293_19235 [Candidatus Promineifilaceae bacterium]|nr:hypothetical protein [Candidatus Promineifilaceae bacterium]